MKRIVTGHSREGNAIFLYDGEPHTFTSPLGNQLSHIWKTIAPINLPHQGDDAATSIPDAFSDKIPRPGETLFGFVTFPGNTEGVMHATDTVDYIVIVAGEVWLALEEGAEVPLAAGDCVVQNGTLHAWHNRSPEPCTLAAIMIGATMNNAGD